MSSKKLGFYFALFQSDPSKHTIRVWIDGDDFCEFYTWDDFFEMIKDYDDDKKRRVFENGSLYTSSVWFWDVDAGTSRIAKRSEPREERSDNILKMVGSTLRKAYSPREPSIIPEAFSAEDFDLIFKDD